MKKYFETKRAKARREKLLVCKSSGGRSEQLCCNKCGSKEIEIWDNHSNCKKCLNVW